VPIFELRRGGTDKVNEGVCHPAVAHPQMGIVYE